MNSFSPPFVIATRYDEDGRPFVVYDAPLHGGNDFDRDDFVDKSAMPSSSDPHLIAGGPSRAHNDCAPQVVFNGKTQFYTNSTPSGPRASSNVLSLNEFRNSPPREAFNGTFTASRRDSRPIAQHSPSSYHNNSPIFNSSNVFDRNNYRDEFPLEAFEGTFTLGSDPRPIAGYPPTSHYDNTPTFNFNSNAMTQHYNNGIPSMQFEDVSMFENCGGEYLNGGDHYVDPNNGMTFIPLSDCTFNDDGSFYYNDNGTLYLGQNDIGVNGASIVQASALRPQPSSYQFVIPPAAGSPASRGCGDYMRNDDGTPMINAYNIKIVADALRMISAPRNSSLPADATFGERFLSCPPEVRIMVYEYVMHGEVQEFRIQFGHHPPFPAILHVCQHIRNEAMGAYFFSATFEFIAHWRGTAMMMRYFSALSPRARGFLFDNKNFSIHVIFDQYHPRFRDFSKRLGKRALSSKVIKRGPYITPEHFSLERAPLNKMRLKSARDAVRAAREEAEKKLKREQGVQALMQQQAQLQGVRHAQGGYDPLMHELEAVYTRVKRALMPPAAAAPAAANNTTG